MVIKNEKEILRRIRESKRNVDFTEREEHAELLLRNHIFLKEKAAEISHGRYSGPWNRFCFRWNINSSWDGAKSTLCAAIPIGASLIFRDKNKGKYHVGSVYPKAEIAWMGSVESFYPEPIVQEYYKGVDPIVNHIPRDCGFIYLRIDARTKPEDIDWTIIRDIQKRIFSKRINKKRRFARVLCWYDLKKQFRLNDLKIAGLWEKYRSDDIDIMKKDARRKPAPGVDRKDLDVTSSLDEKVKKEIQRLAKSIKKLTP